MNPKFKSQRTDIPTVSARGSDCPRQMNQANPSGTASEVPNPSDKEELFGSAFQENVEVIGHINLPDQTNTFDNPSESDSQSRGKNVVSEPSDTTIEASSTDEGVAINPEQQSKLVWTEGNDWRVKRECFSFNKPAAVSTPKGGRVTLSFSQKEWAKLIEDSSKFGMSVEDYIECCVLKVRTRPFAGYNNKELWERLLNFHDKALQFENMLEFSSDTIKQNLFKSTPIMRHWLGLLNEALSQINCLYSLVGLISEDNWV